MDAPGAPARALELAGRSVATSGAVPQGYRVGDTSYTHIIDPAANAPATGDLVSVSVIHESAMQADALATALFAAGRGAPQIAEALGLDSVLIRRDGAGLRTDTTGQAGTWLL